MLRNEETINQLFEQRKAAFAQLEQARADKRLAMISQQIGCGIRFFGCEYPFS
jgi:hypothetical protein